MGSIQINVNYKQNYIWKLEHTNNGDKYFAYDNDLIQEKTGCITLKYGILKCYPIICDEIIWADNLYFYCLEDCNTKDFSEIPSNVLNDFINKSEEAIKKYIKEYYEETDEPEIDPEFENDPYYMFEKENPCDEDI